MHPDPDLKPEEDRRAFLKKCGQFAAITPPAVTFLLSTSMSSKAIAKSGGRGHGPGPGVILGVVAGGAEVGLIEATKKEVPPPAQIAPVQPVAPVAPPPPAPPPPTQLSPAVIKAGERG